MRIHPSGSSFDRRKMLEKELGIKLPAIGKAEFDTDEEVHCENNIGGTVLPLGVAGPLLLAGRKTKGEYIVPLATTEGALVASVNRGCKAIARAGGAAVRTEKNGVTRGPVFEVDSLREAFSFRDWLDTHFADLQKEAAKTSSHIKLQKAETKITGRYVFVRFYFDTGEAMGMNMATIATDHLSSFIEKKRNVSCLALSGNYCVDKKPSFLNFVSGRGRAGWAEIILDKMILRSVLKTTASRFFEVWMGKSVMGSISSGTMGNNAHFANIVSAFYAATGQDLAHVVEGSMGITSAKILSGEKLYFSVYLPSLMTGMIGGGTKLKIKKEALSIMRVRKTEELTEVLTGAVLAGELSLLASLSEGTLAKAHTRLGR